MLNEWNYSGKREERKDPHAVIDSDLFVIGFRERERKRREFRFTQFAYKMQTDKTDEYAGA